MFTFQNWKGFNIMRFMDVLLYLKLLVNQSKYVSTPFVNVYV